MKVTIRKEAEQEIRQTFAWYEKQREGLGTHFITELERGLQRIQTNPVLYAPAYRDVRKIPLRTFPYNVYYIKLDTRLVVLRVLHQRRRQPAW